MLPGINKRSPGPEPDAEGVNFQLWIKIKLIDFQSKMPKLDIY